MAAQPPERTSSFSRRLRIDEASHECRRRWSVHRRSGREGEEAQRDDLRAMPVVTRQQVSRYRIAVGS